jgi:8-oxo-dGTP pyrophosphatase MutT (NUDIX family)
MHSSFSSFSDRLRHALDGPLPGHDAHDTMAPRYQARRSAMSVADRVCREAGVLALFYPGRNREPVLVLTRRRDDLPDHAGQVSFPGGQRHDGESLPETALREAQEEIDLPTGAVDLTGSLTPLYIPPSNFCVHPFVALVAEPPDLRPTDAEVGRILHVPLSTLLAPDARTVEVWTLHGMEVEVPFYDVEGETVWGATAMMLAELLAVIRPAATTAED